jgi:hypothetical protein
MAHTQSNLGIISLSYGKMHLPQGQPALTVRPIYGKNSGISTLSPVTKLSYGELFKMLYLLRVPYIKEAFPAIFYVLDAT